MGINPLIPIGSKIKVEKSTIENELPKKILDNLPQIIHAEVIDYKMTDGMDIGYVLMTDNKLKFWIFKKELNKQTRIDYKIFDKSDSKNILTVEFISKINKVDYEMTSNKNIKTILNPINLISWLIFTLKDIF